MNLCRTPYNLAPTGIMTACVGIQIVTFHEWNSLGESPLILFNLSWTSAITPYNPCLCSLFFQWGDCSKRYIMWESNNSTLLCAETLPYFHSVFKNHNLTQMLKRNICRTSCILMTFSWYVHDIFTVIFQYYYELLWHWMLTYNVSKTSEQHLACQW